MMEGEKEEGKEERREGGGKKERKICEVLCQLLIRKLNGEAGRSEVAPHL